MSRIKKWDDSLQAAAKEIKAYQIGEKKPLITSISHLNEASLGGLYPGDIITLAGLSGHGKSYMLQEIEDSVIDLNPNVRVGLLRFNWEMAVKKLFLRSLKKGTGLKMSTILTSPPDEYKEAMNNIYKQQCRPFIHHCEIMLTPDEFEQEVTAFVEEHKDQYDQFIISVDHILLVKSNDKKSGVDVLLDRIVGMNMKYSDKVTWILLSPLNREIEDRSNPKEMAPRPSDLFQSSKTMFASDIIVVCHNPLKLGIPKYLAVPVDQYVYLKEYFPKSITESKTFVSFDTYNRIFYHYIKLRTPDDYDTHTLFIEEIFKGKKRISDEEYARQRMPPPNFDDF